MKMNAPLLAPVPVAEDNAVLYVSRWGLRNAGAVAFSFAAGYILYLYTDICDVLLPMELMTGEQKAKAKALMLGYLWCGVPLQAAAGTLALLLAGRWRPTRRALACVVLAAAVAGHCMYAGASVIYLTAGVGYLFTIVNSVSIFVDAMDDLNTFFVLMGKRGAE